ncbi:MAG: carbamoyltransferase HypF [Epsilonproteobacteria bacterium]|nr:carbamoyltransferase HypF [Campylobacterota bacterium]
MKRYKYKIEGIVQGVGFRPFIYQIAHTNFLKGYVLNNSLGVEIDIEGESKDLKAFDDALKSQLPPLGRIDFIDKKELNFLGYSDFSIKKSNTQTSKHTLISPDMSICDDCLRELDDKTNFRHNYFFINCTNCGPRYSIIKTVPYDRINTSMHSFIMCQKCEGEYRNPMDRRYHAQPISCADCGPELFLRSIDGTLLAKNSEAIEKFTSLIKEGNIVALKGMGGFHLVCDASNSKMVKLLRTRKKRPTKPFAVMFKNIEEIRKSCEITKKESEMVTSQQRPIVLVKKNEKSFLLSDLVAPYIDRLGVFLPYTPVHVLLLKNLKKPIIATSANRSAEPIITDAKELKKSLGDVVDFYLDYNREIVNASDDSVLQMIGRGQVMMRASRGYTPMSFRYKSSEKRHILAVGAHQKNTIALYIDNQIILSPHIGDLDSVKSCDFFTRTLETFKRLYNFNPEIIICDLHPNYFTTSWAKKQKCEQYQVQHHYAHILSCMFEYKIEKKILGVAWDGTGYGNDGTIWGGEFLVCDKNSYERVAYFEPFSLLGGDKSIKDIKRVAVSMIFDVQKNDEASDFSGFLNLFSKSELSLLKLMYKKNINTIKCSSVGRIFDAVAVFSGICESVTYDGESGLIIESLYDETIDDKYEFYLEGSVIKYKHIFIQILEDKNPRLIASKFINALVDIFFKITNKYDLEIVLAGGVFQNRTILEKIIKQSKKQNICFSQKIPINDGGISVGQLYNYL